MGSLVHSALVATQTPNNLSGGEGSFLFQDWRLSVHPNCLYIRSYFLNFAATEEKGQEDDGDDSAFCGQLATCGGVDGDATKNY